MIKRHLVVTATMATLVPLTLAACGGDGSSSGGGGTSAKVDALNVLDYYTDEPGKSQVGEMLQKCGTSMAAGVSSGHPVAVHRSPADRTRGGRGSRGGPAVTPGRSGSVLVSHSTAAVSRGCARARRLGGCRGHTTSRDLRRAWAA